MPKKAAFWRDLRTDFESLQGYRFSLLWSSKKDKDHPSQKKSPNRIYGESHWSWQRFPDQSLRTRFISFALRGARALGQDSEDHWYDTLRQSGFIRLRRTKLSQKVKSRGAELTCIEDAVKESITLCHDLETNVGSAKNEAIQATVRNGGIAPQNTTLAAKKTTTWKDIEITFLSDERIQIRGGRTYNYAEFGFNDRRGGKPNFAWETLRTMAREGGIIRDGAKVTAEWPKVEKRIQEIRKVLRKHFGITADPIPFVQGTGYRALFKIGCSRSFDT